MYKFRREATYKHSSEKGLMTVRVGHTELNFIPSVPAKRPKAVLAWGIVLELGGVERINEASTGPRPRKRDLFDNERVIRVRIVPVAPKRPKKGRAK